MEVLRPTKFTCPCCGYAGLATSPYDRLPGQLTVDQFAPPYCLHWGNPSYEVCSCCGYEFGFDDEPGTGKGVSFSQYRDEWLAGGSVWFAPDDCPTNWDIGAQLDEAITKRVLG